MSNALIDLGIEGIANLRTPIKVRVSMNLVEQDLMTPAEVAALFRVDPKTVTRWANSGKITAKRTLGGHRRYLRSEVSALLNLPVDKPIF